MHDEHHDSPPRKSPRPRQERDSEYRRIPPHGDVSPDGSRIWPRPANSSRLIVWGGTAVATAAATAGAVMLMRHLADSITSSKQPASRIYSGDDDSALGPRSSAPAKPARTWTEANPAKPSVQKTKLKPRKSRPLIKEIEETSQRLTGSLDGVIASLGGALTGFCKVASQAGNIMRDFSDTADMVRTVLTPKSKPDATQDKAEGGEKD